MNSMESSLIVDQSFSPGKQMKKTPQVFNNNNNNNNPHYLHQIGRVCSNKLSQKYAKAPQVMHDYDKMMMMMMMHGGLYLNNHHAPYYHHHHNHLHHLTNSFPPTTMSIGHVQRQPPLLPLPRPAFHSQPPLRRSQSLSPQVVVARNIPAKNKTPPKKENKKGIHNNNGLNNSVRIIGPTKENGPNDLTRIEMGGSVFRMAPPPSSLPLPRFTLTKPPLPPLPMKLRCNAEAAAVNGAAAENICILLRLR